MTTNHTKPTEAAIPTTFLTDAYVHAVAYAAALHGTQVRKGTQTTYMSHLLGVSSLVLEAGGTEVQAIAALLHDAVEDAGGLPRAADIRARFGDDVAEIVLACSDSTDEGWKRVTPYAVRKSAYLDRLEVEPEDALLVSFADKVHNARAIVTDLERGGPAALKKFNGGPAEIRAYYERFLDIGVRRNVTPVLMIPLRIAVETIIAAIDAATPTPTAETPA